MINGLLRGSPIFALPEVQLPEDVTPLKVTWLFNWLFATCVIIDISGQVFKEDHSYTNQWLIPVRFILAIWFYGFLGYDLMFSDLYKHNWIGRNRFYD